VLVLLAPLEALADALEALPPPEPAPPIGAGS
jgi:hypothetical protein